jgi:hypothetical protein
MDAFSTVSLETAELKFATEQDELLDEQRNIWGTAGPFIGCVVSQSESPVDSQRNIWGTAGPFIGCVIA